MCVGIDEHVYVYVAEDVDADVYACVDAYVDVYTYVDVYAYVDAAVLYM